jgi:hypothetical protein
LFDRSALSGPSSGPVHAISDDGSRVFFDTADPLVSQDTNESLDVYEWEAQDTGGCALSTGCVHLISSGKDPAPSFFLGESPYEYETPSGGSVCRRNAEGAEEPGRHCEKVEGGNVFFGTHARLVPEDTDAEGDIYDARICSGEELCIQPAAGVTAQCEGDACQNPPALPGAPSSGTLTSAGSGNIAPAVSSTPAVTKKAAPCKRGFVRKKVKRQERCVKQPKAKPKHKAKAKKSAQINRGASR